MAKTESAASARGYRPEIDGLRAVAVIAVILSHSRYSIAGHEPFAGGFVGVDVFFVISGYVITRVILAAMADGEFCALDFYVRRAKRLVPALLLVLAFCAGGSYAILFENEARQLARHALFSLFFIQNMNLSAEVGYFDNDAETKPLLHLWSLSVEEQFYIVYPALLVVLWRFRPSATLAVFALLCALSLTLAHYGARAFPDAAFYIAPTRAWELLGGGALGVLEARRGRAPRPAVAWAFTGGGLALVLAAVVGFDAATPHPSLWTLAPVAGTMALIWFATPSDPVTRALSTGVLTGVGRISYGLYLWHWPLFAFAFIHVGREVPAYVTAALTAAAFVLSAASYRWVEAPVRRSAGLGRLRGVMAMSALMTSAAAWGVVGGPAPGSFAARTAGFGAQLDGPVWRLDRNDACLARYDLEGSAGWSWWFCMLSAEAPPEVLLLGTSYANQYYPALASSRALAGAVVLSYGTCDVTTVYGGREPEHPGHPCRAARARLQAERIDEIVRDEPSLTRIFVVADHIPGRPYADRLVRRLRELDARAEGRADITVILPHLLAADGFDTANCLPRPLRAMDPRCFATPDQRAAHDRRFAILREVLAAELSEVGVIDPNEVHCAAAGCAFVIDGLPVFRDPAYHFTRYYNTLFRDHLDRFLRERAAGQGAAAADRAAAAPPAG